MNKLISGFLDLMKLGDDDYDDDYLDDDFDDEDDYEEEKPSKSSFSKKSNKHDDFEEDASYKNTYTKPSYNKGSNNKITQIRQTPSANTGKGVRIVKPTSIEDGRDICEKLLNDCTVIINLEGLDLELGQRIIDFTSGSAYAMHGNLQKISNFIFLVTPQNVEISGDLQDLLGSTFDVSSVRPRY